MREGKVVENAQFNAAIDEYIAFIETLPEAQRARMMELVDETRRRHAHLRHLEKTAQDALDDWRLILKYRLFDYEARQREQRLRDNGQD